MATILTNGYMKLGTSSAVNVSCESITYDPGIQTIPLNVNGEMSPTGAVATFIAPTFSATTPDVSTVLSSIGTLQYSSADGAQIWFQQATAGIRASTCYKAEVDGVMVIPQSITVSRGDIARATLQVLTYTQDEGTTAPVTVSASAANFTFDAFDSPLALGTVTYNGSAIDSVESVTIDFGTTTEVLNDVKYPKAFKIMNHAPTVTVTTMDAGHVLSTYGENPDMDSSLVITFVGFTNGIIDNTAVATLTGTAASATMSDFSAQQGSRVNTGIMFQMLGTRSGVFTVS
jgi:hypothetical protein